MAGPPFLSDLLAVGVAREVTLGTFVNSTDWIPCTGCSLERKPNVIHPKVFRGSRNLTAYGIAGIAAISGDIMAPQQPNAGMRLVAGSLGTESSTTGSTPTAATTLAALAAAAATTISTTATFTAGDIIQIGTTLSGIAECRKVVGTPSGGGPFLVTLDAALTRGHANGVAVQKVVAPFTHILVPINGLMQSFSIEKIMDTKEVQYSGCLVSKAALKCAPTVEPGWTFSMVGQQDQVVGSPPTPSLPTDSPFAPSGISCFFQGAQDLTTSAFDLEVDNGAKAEESLNGQDYPSTVYPAERKLTVKSTAWLQALSGAGATDYFSSLKNAPSKAVKLVMVQGANQITFDMPAATLDDYSNPIRSGSLVRSELTWGILEAPGTIDMTTTLINDQYLNYV